MTNNSVSASSTTLSLSRPICSSESSSSSSSIEDPIAYRNARLFPPQFPAQSAPPPRSRTLATSRITTWNRDHSSDVSCGSSSQLQMLWQQLKQRRDKLGQTKRCMAKKRQELRCLRRQKDEADNALMSILRPMLVSQRGLLQTSAQTLDSRMTVMQDLRDDYRCLESEYEALELTMDEEEKELNRLETRFFTLLGAGHGRKTTSGRPTAGSDAGSEHSTSPSKHQKLPYELTGISAHKDVEDVHPLYSRLTSTMGDLENARDDYQELLYLADQYRHEPDLGTSTGKKAMADAQDFLAEFPAEEARLKTQVSTLEAQVDQLKAECEAKKVMRKHMSVGMAYALGPRDEKFQDIELDDVASILARRPQSLAHASFPELLSQPDHVLASPHPLTALQAFRAATRLPDHHPDKREWQRLTAKEYAIESLMRGDDQGAAAATGDLVSRWLLQQLRQSALAVSLLHSTFVSSRSLRIRDTWRWQRDVLYYWWRDDTVRPTRHRHRDRGGGDDGDDDDDDDGDDDDDDDDALSAVGSSNSSRLGTPLMTRAASDGVLDRRERRPRDSDGAVTTDC
ncbi:hypothetical protein L249_0404 [Ophiocordyceps polyrhachis-furcata BCC 54312]|uniref:Uncharacterized protein n=1 Tax=Ophiocordyceps polyrhachis-furcata BCC 54312 TaxID=1330021 RepID=A0A367LD76_9HYPO|nr:hypothetical protein L249_0404 [Ophiocordyceps polyrhachis-furcata BCC 54312]